MATFGTAKRRLRWWLVLGLVLVPGGVLSVVTWRLIGQERELEASRLAERRALVAARIAQRMLSRLELERASARAARGRGAFTPDGGVLVLVAPVGDRGMALPWESPAPDAPVDAGYRRRIAEGERQEFGRDRPNLAAASYAAASGSAPDPASRLGARLREARALSRAGRPEAALATFAAVASAPPDVRDRDGMPMALYGAEGLLSADRPDVGAVLRALEGVVGTTLSPPALYALRDLARETAAVAHSVAHPDGEPPSATIARARSVERWATAEIEVAERVLELRHDLPALLSLTGAAVPDSARGVAPGMDRGAAADPGRAAPLPSEWRPWGPEPWLVGLTGDRDRTLVLVADPARLLRSLSTEASDDLAPLAAGVRLSTVPEPDAELLGPGFPALFAVLPDAAVEAAGGSRFGRVLLLLVLPLVLAVTALAAVLLWRDVRRETETAAVRAQFVSSVSHELKTPLTSIRMYAQTLLMGRHRGEANRRSYLETIVNESERLTRLINNVLDFSRIESGGRSYRMAPASLESVVSDSARAMSYPLEQGGFDLRVHIDDGIPEVRCDRDALTQALVNLLSNAVKFSGDERVIELELVRENGDAALRVRDHGRGIEKRHHEAVFEQFFRAPEAETDGVPGTGLGLALVAHLARAHGGRVELDSAPGRGSTFTIRLPLPAEEPGSP
ncbi:MAG: HAMP domain-containing sensor histidine kinase [Gemmatimonadota bacterium]|jgi:signal transduction histidine kinase